MWTIGQLYLPTMSGTESLKPVCEFVGNEPARNHHLQAILVPAK